MKYFKRLFLTLLILGFTSNLFALGTVRLGPSYFPETARGRPVALGSIYVGQPDLDPSILANQKQLSVRQESGTVVTVSQPISTSAGGIPLYLGSPVTLLVDGYYSLKVLDSSGTQVYYVPSSNPDTLGAAQDNCYPDYNAVNQGLTGDNDTIKYCVDTYGSDQGTIVLRHNSGNATTTYTLTTSETIPANITLEVERGAVIDGAGTLSGLDSARIEWFGAVGDGATNNTTAINKALAAAKKVYFWSGTFYVESSITPVTNNEIVLDKNCIIQANANNLNIFSLDTVNNVSITGGKIVGDNTNDSFTSGNGIYASTVTGLKVEGVTITNIGDNSGGAGILLYSGVVDAKILNNSISGGTGNSGASDITVYGACENTLISGNDCTSSNDIGIYANAISSSLGKMRIVNNYVANHTRHGIVTGYDTYNSMGVIVAGNNIVDCLSTGIYIQSNEAAVATQTRGIIVSNNIVDSCSGAGGNNVELAGGIVAIGQGGAIITGNTILNTGRTSAGVDRDGFTSPVTAVTQSVAIRANGEDNIGGKVIITNNTINKSIGYGIKIYKNVPNLLIANNHIYEAENLALFFNLTDSADIKYQKIINNVIDVGTSDGGGITYIADTDLATGIEFKNNTLIGKKGGTTKYGFYTSSGFAGSIIGNEFRNWDTGVHYTAATATYPIGRTQLFKNNILVDSTIGGYFYISDRWSFIQDTVLSGNTSDFGGSAYIAQASSLLPNKVFPTGTAAPTSGDWLAGDRAIRTPAAGQPKAWVCTVTGTYSAASEAGTSTSGSFTITALADTSDFFVGEYVDASAGFAVLTGLKIESIVANTSITVNRAANATGACTLSTTDPTWVSEGNL